MNPLKTACHIFFFIFAGLSLHAQQFYLRGEVKDESGNPLPNVNILLHSTGYVYRTGSFGSFGILTNKNSDTVSFWSDGYQKEKRIINAENYITVRLKLSQPTINTNHRPKLASLTKGLTGQSQKDWFTGDETYTSLMEN